MTTRDLSLLTAAALFASGSGAWSQPDPKAFETRAVFSIDEDAMTLTSVAAAIEPRPGAPGYSGVQTSFYAFKFTAADIAGAVKGRVESMDAKWTRTASDPKVYNHSYAFIQLTVDKDRKVTQVDLSVPGHGCTIAGSAAAAAKALPGYQFDGKRLMLKGKGSFICDMSFMKSPNRTYGWDLDLNIPVFEKVP